MAKSITAARRDKPFQATLALLQDVPEAPHWPFATVTPEEWSELSDSVRRKIDAILVELVEMVKGPQC